MTARLAKILNPNLCHCFWQRSALLLPPTNHKKMENKKECLVCKRDPNAMPLTRFYYQESDFYICAQHIPILIHDPQKLIGLLPDADKLEGA